MQKCKDMKEKGKSTIMKLEMRALYLEQSRSILSRTFFFVNTRIEKVEKEERRIDLR